MTTPFCTVGVEEEYHIVDAETFALRPRIERLLPAARDRLGDRVQPELNASQIEIGTAICGTLADVREQLRSLRRAVAEVAEGEGCRIVATSTHPFSEWQGLGLTPRERYLKLGEQFAQLAREQLVTGCHVHVAVPAGDAAIAISDLCRPWLPVLLALTANSPFWEGSDTGYASYRTEVFARWPTTGPPPRLGRWAVYEEVVAAVVRTGIIEDATKLYWDLRPSVHYQTLEFRIADVCLRIDDAVLLAGLCRSLVRTAGGGGAAGDIPDPALRAARWRAARSGLGGALVHPLTGAPRPAAEVVAALLTYLRPDLEAHGERDEIEALAAAVLGRGNGADEQRRVAARSGDLARLVAHLASETTAEV